MANKDRFDQYDETASNNTDCGGIGAANANAVALGANLVREHMSHHAEWNDYADVASATTTAIGAVPDRYIRITGTTTITGLGTVKEGTRKDVVFAGALTLTHNGTSLILPGAANITTAAGDTAVFMSEGSGNWRCLAYIRAATSPDNAEFADNVFRVQDNADATKELAFEVSGIATATTRTVTWPDSDVSIYPEASAANFRAATADKTLVCDTVWAAMAEVALTSTSNAVAWDMETGIDFKIDTLGENTTIGAPTNTTVGKKGRLRIVQDGTGSRTVAWNAVFEFAGGAAPTASTAAGAEDVFYYDVISASRILVSYVQGIA